MSNFPINVFHQPYCIPTAPTFDAKIGIEGTEPTEITKPSQLFGAVFMPPATRWMTISSKPTPTISIWSR